jgi:hypothetical protein
VSHIGIQAKEISQEGVEVAGGAGMGGTPKAKHLFDLESVIGRRPNCIQKVYS